MFFLVFSGTGRRLLPVAFCLLSVVAGLFVNPVQKGFSEVEQLPAVSLVRSAGLDPEDFELYTTYENIGWCKPNPEYFREIMRRLDLLPEDCIMVGNDADEDMAAEKTGMKVFLLTDCLINKSGADIDKWPHGGFGELISFIESELGA